jgi:GNAT superfamily N-acetyltransferase
VPSDTAALAFDAAGAADVGAVVDLVQAAYRGESSRAGWTTEADLLDGARTDAEAVAAVIADPHSVLLLGRRPGGGERGDRPAILPEACCHLRDEGGGVAYFGMFAVCPGLQGGGIGRAVIAEAERRVAAVWGAHEMRMTVIAQRTDLIAWYVRLGFAPTGETQPFPYGDERFGIPKRPDLEFSVLSKAVAARP